MAWIRRAPLLLFLLVVAPVAHAQTSRPQTWELRNGQWQPVTVQNPAATQPTVISDPQLDAIERTIEQGHASRAMKDAVRWLRKNRGSPARDRGLYLMAHALYRYGDRIKAFYYCDELMDEYPASPLFTPALELQYAIADAYLSGYKRRFLGMPLLDADDEAVEMLYRIQQRAPGSALAERCLLRTADFYYADEQYDLSAAVYAFYAEHYPRSPAIARVRLRQAFSNLAQFRGSRFDPTPVIDARTTLLDLRAQYPEIARKENIDDILRRIDAVFARKIYTTADFYRRTSAPRSAAYLYEYLVQAYPDSPEAQGAQAQLQRLPRPAVRPNAKPLTTPGIAVSDANQ
jgi:outer membrane assembly lipoprotein YfiO